MQTKIETKIDYKVLNERIKQLANVLCYKYKNIDFLKSAMYTKKVKKDLDGSNRKNYQNESLATLGDAVLKLLLTESCFDKSQDKKDISNLRQNFECNDNLFNLCNKLQIYKFAFNETQFYQEKQSPTNLPHSQHDFYVEAIIGAIYKDRGFKYTKKWYKNFLIKFL